jgi:acyl-CoA synthetase (NDP forming)
VAPDGDTAEVAFSVADRMHGRGVATLLLEHLVSRARDSQLHAFTAEVLTENTAMLKVFAAAGLPARKRSDGEVTEMTFPLPHADDILDGYLDVVARRERSADAASLRHVFEPRSVAVIGASREPGTPGRAVADNICGAGFEGRIYPVNPRARQVGGEHCLASAAELPDPGDADGPVDLAVIAVPAPAVLKVAEQCGQRGVRALVVITAGLDAAGRADLLACCRRHGMRLIGPNCFGVAVPAAGLDATFAARHPRPGSAGLAVQSGGVGIALLEHLSRLGIGVSSFASLGDKCDVSGNDMLLWWEQDQRTRLAVLYLESFGNPRKFARTARRLSKTMPVLTLYAGRSEAGQRAAASHTAAAATPLAAREALFGQAGVIATTSLGELLGTAAFLRSQQLPAGNRIAIVTNAGGAGALAAGACAEAGLQVAATSTNAKRELRHLLPLGAALTGPVDTRAAVSADVFRRCLETVAADDNADAVLALVVPTASSDLVPAIQAAQLGKPLAAAVLDQAEAIRLLPAIGAPVPAYADPETPARALGHAARYRAWRERPGGHVPELTGLATADAREIVYAFLARSPGGGWLPAQEVSTLLACYEIPLDPSTDDGPVPQVQPMITGGTEVIVGVAQEPVFGPLVVFGLGGVATEVLGDHAARLAPLTSADADELIESVKCAPLLHGYRGAPAADIAALRDLLLRVSRLADDLPEIAELDLNPVIAGPDGATATGARIRVTPARSYDPFLRKLR